MDAASSEVLSPSSDRIVRPVQHPRPNHARESANFTESSAEPENKVASVINAALTLSANTSDNVSQISIETLANTLLNRGRILLMLKNRPGAMQCFKDALNCSTFSSDEGLQKKCRDWMQRFREGLGVCDPLLARRLTQSVMFGDGGTVSDFELLLYLDTKYEGGIPHSMFGQAVPTSQPPSALFAPLPTPAVQPGNSHTPGSSVFPPGKVDLMVSGLKDTSASQRRLPERLNLSLAPSPRSTPIHEQAVQSPGSKMPSSGYNHEQGSGLLSRRREHLSSSRARASPSTPTHQGEHSAVEKQNVTMVGPLPQPRRPLNLNQNLSLEVDNPGSMLSTDTPALTKLAETISANPSPQSDSSVATAVHRRPSILHSRTPPSLAIQPSGTYVPSTPHSTVPHHQSPLREAFVPDPDLVADVASIDTIKVQSSPEHYCSSNSLDQENDNPLDHDSDILHSLKIDGKEAVDSKIVLSNVLRSPELVDHQNSDETLPEQGCLESATITKTTSNRSNPDTVRASRLGSGRRRGVIVTDRIEQKVAKLKTENQKESEPSEQPQELTERPEWHEQSGNADSNTSTAGTSTTSNTESSASDKIPIGETNESLPKNDSAIQDPGHAQIEAFLAENVKRKILDPSEKYFTMNPDETMTEQDRLDAERVINVILHEALLNITPDIVMDEYLKYQPKKDGAAEGRSRLGSADCTE